MGNVISWIKNRISWTSMFSVNGFYVIFGILIVGYLLWCFFGHKVKSTIEEYSKTLEDALIQFKKDNTIPENLVANSTRNKDISEKIIQNSNRNIQIPENIQEIIESKNDCNLEIKPQRKLKYEDECHRIIEELTGRKFHKNARPDFLKNPKTTRNLELDCFDGENIALEYQGIQHYKYPNPFHKTEKEFEYQIQKDKWKFEKCEENNVFLIRVPYTIPFRKLQSYIKSRLDMYYEGKTIENTSCYIK